MWWGMRRAATRSLTPGASTIAPTFSPSRNEARWQIRFIILSRRSPSTDDSSAFNVHGTAMHRLFAFAALLLCCRLEAAPTSIRTVVYDANGTAVVVRTDGQHTEVRRPKRAGVTSATLIVDGHRRDATEGTIVDVDAPPASAARASSPLQKPRTSKRTTCPNTACQCAEASAPGSEPALDVVVTVCVAPTPSPWTFSDLLASEEGAALDQLLRDVGLVGTPALFEVRPKRPDAARKAVARYGGMIPHALVQLTSDRSTPAPPLTAEAFFEPLLTEQRAQRCWRRAHEGRSALSRLHVAQQLARAEHGRYQPLEKLDFAQAADWRITLNLDEDAKAYQALADGVGDLQGERWSSSDRTSVIHDRSMCPPAPEEP